jgi:glycerol-3-phosphate dehydrogenase (NAD(P)+)
VAESATRVAVLGAGSWGTAFAKLLCDAGCAVTVLARRPEIVAALRDRHNNDYLPGVTLPGDLAATGEPGRAIARAQVVVLAVPAQKLRSNLTEWAPLLQANTTVVSLIKGIELGTDKRMSEIVADVTALPSAQIAVVSGPNLAREVAAEQPAASVVACTDEDRAIWLRELCRTGYFRPYSNVDVVGCELGGAVKNVIALACGMAAGMGFGDNTKASLLTRGLAETARLGAAMGADPLTFAGLAGLGDLAATCMSPLSRNRGFGERLGRGETVAEATAAIRQTAEGVQSCRSVLDLARRHGVEMPITEGVVAVCRDGLRPAQMVEALMTRKMRSE